MEANNSPWTDQHINRDGNDSPEIKKVGLVRAKTKKVKILLSNEPDKIEDPPALITLRKQETLMVNQ